MVEVTEREPNRPLRARAHEQGATNTGSDGRSVTEPVAGRSDVVQTATEQDFRRVD